MEANRCCEREKAMQDGNVVGYKKGSKGSVDREVALRIDMVCAAMSRMLL